MEVLLVELRNNSPQAGMRLEHFNPRNNSVSEMLSPLRAVFRNVFYKVP